MKKIYTAIAILIAIIICLLVFYFDQDVSLTKNKTPFNAIPENAIAIAEFNYAPDVLDPYQNNELMLDLFGENKLAELTFFKNVIDSFPAIRQEIENKKVLISIHRTQSDQISFLFILETKHPKKILNKEFLDSIEKQQNKVTERNFNGVKITDLAFADAKKVFGLAYKNGLLLGSFSPTLLEKSIYQLSNKPSLAQKPSFLTVKSFSNPRSQTEIFLNFEQLPELFNVLSTPSSNNKLQFLNKSLSWSVLSNNFKEDALMLNGFTTVERNSYLFPYLSQQPQLLEFDALTSNKTALKVDFGISNFAALATSRKKQMEEAGTLTKYQARINLINTQNSVDFDTDISNFIGNGVSYILQENNSRNISQELLAAMQVVDVPRAIRFLSGNQDPSLGALNYPVYRVRFNDFLSLAFGDIFSDIRKPYYTILQNNIIVFANDLQTLERFVNDFIAQETLEKDRLYSDFKLYTAGRSTVSAFVSMEYSRSMIQSHLIAEIRNNIRNNKEGIGNLYGLSFQLSSKQDGFITNLYLQRAGGTQKRSAQTWMARVDAPIRMKPIISLNSSNDEHEVIFQDDDNNLYLIGSTGRLKWKVKMTEKIIGDIHPVDIGRNNRLDHFVFNTATRLFVINRNGRAMSGFPVNLPRKSNSGLTIIPTSDEFSYRIFIEADNKAIYGYSINGRLMPGWNPKDRLGKLERSVSVMQFDKQYYFLAPDEGGTFGIFNFAGNELFKIRERGNYKNPFYAEVKNTTATSRFISTDNKGNIVSLYLNGKTSVKSVADLSNKHYYLFGNIAGNSDGDHVFIDGNRLIAYNSDFTLLFTYEFPVDIMDAPFLVKVDDSGKQKLGVIFRPTNQVYLFNEDGKILDGFPIKGATPVSVANLMNDERKFIVVGGQDSRIYAYELK